MGPHRPAAAVLLAALLAGCAGDGDEPQDDDGFTPIVDFDTIAVRLVSPPDTIEISAELADDADRRMTGLMERPSLPPDHGMVFVYPGPQDSTGAFYMYRTRVPLDIAFLDDDGRIVSIRSMDPCESPNPRLCPTYAAGAPFRAALEVNRGFFDRHGIELGDRVEPLAPLIEAAR